VKAKPKAESLVRARLVGAAVHGAVDLTACGNPYAARVTKALDRLLAKVEWAEGTSVFASK